MFDLRLFRIVRFSAAVAAALALQFSFASAAHAQVDQLRLSHLVSSGNLAQAQAELEASDPSPADRLFLTGLILKARGQLDQAAALFRQVLRDDPGYLNARRELAHTLLLRKDYDGAEYYFTGLLKIDRNETMRSGYRRFLTVINQNRPVGVYASFSLLPSTNVNRGTTNITLDTVLGTFTIDEPSKAASGIGAYGAVGGFLRQDVGPGARFSFDWRVSGKRYENTSFNDLTGFLSLSFAQQLDAADFKLAAFGQRSWRGDNADLYSFGASLDLSAHLTPADTVALDLRHEERRFPNQSYQNGPFSSARLTFDHRIDQSLDLSAGLRLDMSRPQAAHLQYDGGAVIAGFSKVWDNGLTTGLTLEAGQRQYVGVFPLMSGPRSDGYYSIGASLKDDKIDLWGFSPSLSCSYTHNSSNVALYDYDSADCQLSVTRSF